ncbi:MAG TPA: hypothetical protein VJH20_00295 [Candidatus Nanoarchaeia archaeon]|nr:hypothetical protein [Candidatus Nanoarchaeia archaeon]
MEKMTEPRIYEDIRPIGESSAVMGNPFDKAKRALEEQGYEIISLEDNARLRIQKGRNSYVSRHGNFVKEGVLYVPNKGIFLTKNSPIMRNAEEATNCHRNGNCYFLTDDQVEEALADSVEIKDKSVPINKFAENAVTAYAFGEWAEHYGLFLKEAGIEKMLIRLVEFQDKPFASQLWFFKTIHYWEGHVLDGDYSLSWEGGGYVRGLRNNLPKAFKTRLELIVKEN